MRRLRVFGALAAAVAIAELVLCFRGPIAFVQKPSLVVFPPFAAGLTEEQVVQLAAFAERQLALTRSYQIVSLSFIEDLSVRTRPDFDRSTLRPRDYQQAQQVARELSMERFGLCWAYAGEEQWTLSISIRETTGGAILRSGVFSSRTYEDLLEGLDLEGRAFDFRTPLAASTRGLGPTDWLVLALLGLQLVVGALALFGREPGLLVEVVWAPALVLFVFAYIFARSANMDYVQRYIASGGELRLAASTAAEQLRAALRFGPLLLLDGAWYVLQRLRGRGRASGALTAHFRRWALPWVVLSAALFGFSFPSAISLEGLGPLAWFALVPLFLVLLSAAPAMGVLYGVVFGALQGMVVNYWLGTYNYVTLHLVTIAFAAQYLLFMVLLVGLIRLSGRWGFLTAAAAWLLFDYVRSIGLLAYPWGLIGVTQYRFLPLIQIASLGGVWAVDFVVVLGNSALAWALAGWAGADPARAAPVGAAPPAAPATVPPPAGTAPVRTPRRAWLLPLGVFAAVFVVSLAAGGAILWSVRRRLYGDPATPRATIVLLQQNTDPRKHEYEANTQRLKALTDQALAELPARPDLVAWPEGGFMLDLTYWGDAQRADSSWGRQVLEFRAYQEALGIWLLTGTQDHERVSFESEVASALQRDFNSSVLLDDRGRITAFYHKMRLVPFSEYFPLDKGRFAALYAVFQEYDISDWDVGTQRTVYAHPKMRFLTPICFEDVFADHVRRFVAQGADLILNMSNDYWSLSPVEGRQHGVHALFRAVENQRPLLRTTCSGYTVHVDAAGQIQPGSPQPYTPGYVIARVPLPSAADLPLTLYTRWGDWFPLTCAAALAAGSLAAGFTLGVRRLRRVRWPRRPT